MLSYFHDFQHTEQNTEVRYFGSYFAYGQRARETANHKGKRQWQMYL